MQNQKLLNKFVNDLMSESNIRELYVVLNDAYDILEQRNRRMMGFNSGFSNGGNSVSSGGSGGSECVGSYPVSGYTRSDGTEVSSYIRTCGAAHAGQSDSNSSNNANNENDWDYVNTEDLDEYLDKELLNDYYKYRTPVLEGKVEHEENFSKNDYLNDKIYKIKDIYSKYQDLSLSEAVQKAMSKSSMGDSSEKQYYGYSANLADGEVPSDFMKKQNDFYKLSDIQNPKLKKIYMEKAAKMYGLDPASPDIYERVKNVVIVIPKRDSQLYSQIKNSETFQRWVAENYWKIKNKKIYNASIEFPKNWENNNAQRSLFATIHNADLFSKLNDDGSLSLILSDAYDFSLMDKMNYSGIKNIKDLNNRIKHNMLVEINNNAYRQQISKQIRNYLLSTEIVFSKEELKKILQKYKY